jgi:hypothetical protein
MVLVPEFFSGGRMLCLNQMNDQGDQLFGQGTEGEREHRAQQANKTSMHL